MFWEICLGLIAARVGYKYVKKHVVEKNKLKKDLIKYSKTDMVKVVELPDELYTGNDEAVKENAVYQKVSEDFVSKILDTVPREDLDNFYRNFVTLTEKDNSNSEGFKFAKTKLVKALTGLKVPVAFYDPEKNIVHPMTFQFVSQYLGANYNILLRVASTRVDNNTGVIYSGISQKIRNQEDNTKWECYGEGINAGLTQYYVSKFFDPENKREAFPLVNKEEQAIAKALERIIGEENLRSYYFRTDLDGFVKDLEQYATREDIYKFINYTDVLLHYKEEKDLKFGELQEVKKFINLFLIRAYFISLQSR